RHTRSKRDWSSDVCSSDLRIKTQNLHQYEKSPVPSQAPPPFRLRPQAAPIPRSVIPIPLSGRLSTGILAKKPPAGSRKALVFLLVNDRDLRSIFLIQIL